jgi:oligopeptide/dipeptide ABC transporter ATP-binding protein
MDPLLSIEHLCKDFATGVLARRRVRVLDDISLRVYPGETLGLVGESGGGKTTLARCALRLIEPTAGSVFFDGTDLLRLPPAALRLRRREFQMVFQDPAASVHPRMTVGQILSEPLAVHRMGTRQEREARVRELLEDVGLDAAFMGRRPSQLSGGQQQRLVVARALALKPRLLIADEPVSALDASVQAQILNLLTEIRRRFGLTLILISHSLPVVHYLCSRIAVLYLGRLVEVSTAEEFFSAPRHPYSQALARSTPALDTPAAWPEGAARGESGSIARPPRGCRYHPRCPSALARCRTDTPDLTVTDGENRVACFLYSQ